MKKQSKSQNYEEKVKIMKLRNHNYEENVKTIKLRNHIYEI